MCFCYAAKVPHPFNRYSAYTDLQVLNAFSAKPLRKSVRVNTLKTDVETFKKRAGERGWMLESVPWCPEGFYIDRVDREEALGKDLLHLTGHMYMQEAASMLPAALLDPQPGEDIFDMSAAPGSKTTQIAAGMRGRGVIIANDVQEKRLWTLKTSIHRSGVMNAIVTKKVGQWFSKHLAERFDRVLCDAPCTAQGTIRKDSDALEYCSLDNIGKMARLQVSLLASAVNTAKVGGRVVYSTCTLTPEENEGVVMEILKMFEGKVEVVDPRELRATSKESRDFFDKAVDDSHIVQQNAFTRSSALKAQNFPSLRLWPQTHDTEGFFSVVLLKTARTCDVLPMKWVPFQERAAGRRQTEEISGQIKARYGDSFLEEGDRLFLRGETLLIATKEVEAFGLPMQNYALGMPFGKLLKDGRALIDHEIVTLRGGKASKNTYELTHEQIEAVMDARDIECPESLNGHIILTFQGIPVGMGLAKDGRLKNNLPRRMVRFG